MTGQTQSFTDADLPALFRSADSLSSRGRIRRRNFFIVFLICDLGAAFCSAFEDHPRGLSIAALVLLTVGLTGTIALLQESPEADWYRGRALAESVKTLSWRYMMCAEPYSHGLPPGEADRKLIQELSALLSFYLNLRLKDQKRWYSRSADRAHKWLTRCRWTLVGIQLCLVLTAISTLPWPRQPFSAVGLMSALAASVIAWQHMNEFGGLAVAYNLTAHELAGQESLIGPVDTNKSLEDFVLNAERAISREHTLWRARRTE
jgi:hypothetical protein